MGKQLINIDKTKFEELIKQEFIHNWKMIDTIMIEQNLNMGQVVTKVRRFLYKQVSNQLNGVIKKYLSDGHRHVTLEVRTILTGLLDQKDDFK